MKKKRAVVVCFDEMSLNACLHYEKHGDHLVGFQDFARGIGRTTARVNEALVVMVRCLSDKWKQRIGPFLSGNAMTRDTLKVTIEKGVEKLLNTGFDVRAIVADQGSNNRRVFHLLGVTEDKPYISSGQHRVWGLYGPPHLIKNVRNNSKKHSAIFEDKKLAHWDHIEIFYQHESMSSKFSCPKANKCSYFQLH